MSELRFVKTPEQLIEAAENNLEFLMPICMQLKHGIERSQD